MDNVVFIFLAGLAGLAIGLLISWPLARAKISATELKAKSDVATELAQLHEQVKQIAILTSKCSELENTLSAKNTELTLITAQLAERTNALDNTELRLIESRTHLETAQTKSESLHREVQETTNKIAALTEQNTRIAGLERDLAQIQEKYEKINAQYTDLRENLGSKDSLIDSLQKRAEALQTEKSDALQKIQALQTEQQELTNKIADLSAKLEAEHKQGLEKIILLNDAKEQLSDKFKTLANEILEEKSKKFIEQNQSNLGYLLEPLKNQLQEFKGKVEEVYVQEGKERSALAEQLKHMMSLNQQLSKDAHNLTRALKGDNKAQGSWGELILERVLDASGLRKGHEYDVQESHKHEDGGRLQPDVVIHLPEDKHLIIDSKVSIVAYSNYVAAESDEIRHLALKQHIESCKSHIRSLSEKKYQNIYGIKSLDFVLMFIPIEPAFMLAIAHDGELWQEAWRKNILLVSPSTLLFVVRTVAHLWRQEQQNKNAQDIAKRGAELYDKVAGFVSDMGVLGERLTQAKDSYDKAYSKLSKGKGNVLRQVEMLKELGVKPTKQLPVLEQLDDEADISLSLEGTENTPKTT